MGSSASIPAALFRPVLTAAAIRNADRYTIESYGIAGSTLMEVAGRAVVSAILARYGPVAGKRVTVLCGRGNNGGDGYVAARVLHVAGAFVRVIRLGEPEEHSEDAGKNLRVLLNLHQHDDGGRLSVLQADGPSVPDPTNPGDLCVDALLGTGFNSEIREPIRNLVAWMNVQRAPVVSVDIPTGLHSDHGTVLGPAVRADLTVTMGAYKAGLLINEGPTHTGEVEVAEIGIPTYALLEAHRQTGCALLTTDEAVRSLLPVRSGTAHKYNVGLALTIGGSPGLTGAPVMASTAAARVGAGAVVCACSSTVQPVLAGKMTEVMTLGLPASESEGIDPDGALETLASRLRQARSALIGCGLGRLERTMEFVRRFCAVVDLPLVVDADGLNALSGHEDLIREHSQGRWILTPHEGEFERLAEGADLGARIEAVRHWAGRWNSVLILKGMPSLVGTPEGRVYVCGTGNPALATAGTGDVLAGLAAGLLAQGLSPEQAAVCAVHLGGAAADEFVLAKSARSMQALDLLEVLPGMLRRRYETQREQPTP